MEILEIAVTIKIVEFDPYRLLAGDKVLNLNAVSQVTELLDHFVIVWRDGGSRGIPSWP